MGQRNKPENDSYEVFSLYLEITGSQGSILSGEISNLHFWISLESGTCVKRLCSNSGERRWWPQHVDGRWVVGYFLNSIYRTLWALIQWGQKWSPRQCLVLGWVMAVTQVKEKGGERCDGFSLGCFALDMKGVQMERVSHIQLEIYNKHCKERPSSLKSIKPRK